MRGQFKIYLSQLSDSEITAAIPEKDLKIMEAKVLIHQFLCSKSKLYLVIELIMQSLVVSCVKQSCESVVESLVSQYENLFDARRSTNETASNEEFEITINGPNLANADTVIKEDMNAL